MERHPTTRHRLARRLFALASITCALAVMAGAFGAHGLRDRLEPRALDQWITAARYLMYGGLGALVAALLSMVSRAHSRGAALASAILLAGGYVFAGAVGTLALGGPRLLGAVAPLGGLGLILGFVALAVAGGRARFDAPEIG